jgi:tetratricopeptide (TPR) repeat protein
MRARLAIRLLAGAGLLALGGPGGLGAARAQDAPAASGPAAPAPAEATPAQATPAQAPAETVLVRAGQHPDRSRLVFDFGRPVDYALDRQGDTVRLSFARPGTADLSAVPAARLRGVRSVSQEPAPGRMEIRIAVPEGSGLRHFRSGNSVAVDVLDPPRAEPRPAQAEPARPAQAAAPQVPAAQPTSSQPTSSRQPAARPPAPQPASASPATTPATAPVAAPQAAIRTSAAPSPAAPSSAASSPATTAAAPAAQAAPPAAARPTPAALPQPPARPSAPASQGSAASAAAAAPATPAAERPLALVVDPGQPASAAVFVRGGHLFAVFDRALPADAPRIESAGRPIGAPEPLAVSGGAGFRVPLPEGLDARVEREGTAWRIVLAPPSALPAAPGPSLPVLPEPDFLLGPRVLVRAGQAATPIALADPAVGDRLFAVPLGEPGRAVTRRHDFLQARFLPAVQGVVLRPLDDALEVRAVRDGVEVTAGGGLALSAAEDIRAATPPAAAPAPSAGPAGGRGHRLLDVAAWKRGGAERFNEQRQALQQAVVAAPEAERDRARLDLARFYFSHGYGPEASGMLGLVLASRPELEDQPEFRALRGGARALAGDFAAAREDLEHPALDGHADARLWRGLAAAGRGDRAAAARDFQGGRAALDDYPDAAFRRLALAGAEALVEAGAHADAARFLDAVEARVPQGDRLPAVRYLRGRIAAAAGRQDEAAALWAELADSTDRKYRTRAEFSLAVLDQGRGRIGAKEAIDRLERLRYAWRGDGFELDVLERLGETYAAAGDVPNAIDALRTAQTIFPDDPRAPALARRAAQVFSEPFLKDGAAGMRPLDALALYDRYKDLAPKGADGDLMERNLAERLVEIDLLGRAAEVLDAQLARRLPGTSLQGATRAEVGARLASIRLLDGKPAEATAALDRSEVEGIAPALASERRVLRARALADLGRFAEAAALLGDDRSPPAELLRIDVAWRGGRWAEAAEALGRAAGPPPADGTALTRERSQLVLNRAIALALAGDGAGLARLRAEYGPAMAAGPDADGFRLLTRPGGQGGAALDAATIRSRVAEVDVFRNFLAGYRGARAPAPAAN